MSRTLITLSLLAALLAAGHAPGQTNAPPPSAGTSAPVSSAQSLVAGWSQIEVSSENGSVDLRSNLWIYWDDVHVRAPSGEVTCEYLVGRMRPDRSFENITAETNVVLNAVRRNGEKVHGTGSKLVYTSTISGNSTNEMLELSGDPPPVITSDQFTNIADLFIYDITHDRYRFIHPHTFVRLPNRGATATNTVPKTAGPLKTEPAEPSDASSHTNATGTNSPSLGRHPDE